VSDDSDIEYDDQVTMAQMQEVYGEYATSLTERVKRRRNQHVTYDTSEDNDSNMSDSHLRSELRHRLAADDTSSEASNASIPEGLLICAAGFADIFLSLTCVKENWLDTLFLLHSAVTLCVSWFSC